MDPKLFAAAQQGMFNNQQNVQNPNLMMPFQSQSQQDLQQFNQLSGAGLPFNPALLGGAMSLGQNDLMNFDQPDLSGMNNFNPNLMNSMNLSNPLQQQQQLRQPMQQPQTMYSPQNIMNFQQGNNHGGLQFQNRGIYQNNGNILPNTPQGILLQQQQQQHQQEQQQALSINRAKQSPSQSPALNSSHFSGTGTGSPVIGSNSHMAGARMGSDYTGSPMGPMLGSPVQNFQQGNGISPSPQMGRVIPSQATNRYMQQLSVQQQQQQHKNQHHQQQQQAMLQQGISPSMSNPSIPPYASQDVEISKSYNAIPSYMQQATIQSHASPAPRHSVTSGSTRSTPRQQHQQLEGSSTPQMSPVGVSSLRQPSIDTPMDNMASPSPRPSPGHSDSVSIGHNLVTEKENSQRSLERRVSNHQPQVPSNTQASPATYMPKTRNVDTYGGIDLKYFEKFEIKPPVPHIGELGVVDIQAIILSLKSGMKMELTNALNILTVLTVQPNLQHQQPPNLPLSQCEDLLDTLLDYLEQDILGTCKRFDYLCSDTKTESVEKDVATQDLTYADLFDMSLDEMKSLIPQLEDTTSDIWASLRERTLCIFNILRNLSFINDNVEYLAKHQRFTQLLLEIVDKTKKIKTIDGRDSLGNEAWFSGVRRMDALDFRKSILIILSNTSIFVDLEDLQGAATFVELIRDFLVYGPDTYYALLAIETWSKFSVGYNNRQQLHTLFVSDPKTAQSIEDIWLELTSVIRREYFSPDGRVMHAMTSNQLASLELTIIGLYNVLVIVENDTLKQELALRNKNLGMLLFRLCMTLAESGNQQFSLVTKRSMEIIRSIICGGDGSRKRPINQQQQHQQQQQHHHQQPQRSVLEEPKKSDENQKSVSEIANRLLDMPAIRERFLISLCKPSTDAEILKELTDIVTLIEEENIV